MKVKVNKKPKEINAGINYRITINQIGIVKAGLWDMTDLTDWAILEYIRGWKDNPKTKTLEKNGEVYIWINYDTLSKEMPMIKIEQYRHLSYRIGKMVKLGLLKRENLMGADQRKRTYLRLTQLAIDCMDYQVPKVASRIGGLATLNQKSQPNEHQEPAELTSGASRIGGHNPCTINPCTINPFTNAFLKEETVKEKKPKEDTDMKEQKEQKEQTDSKLNPDGRYYWRPHEDSVKALFLREGISSEGKWIDRTTRNPMKDSELEKQLEDNRIRLIKGYTHEG